MNRLYPTPPPPRRRDVRLRAVHDRAGAVRVDDGAGAEDLLFSRAVVDGDVPGGVRLRRWRSACTCSPSRPAADRVTVARRRADGRVRPDRADHRAAVGAQGVGRVVAVGRAADVGARAVADLRRVPAAAEVRRARLGEAVGGGRALRHGERAVRLLVGERLADRASEDDCRPDAGAGHARAASGGRSARSCSCSSCCSIARMRLEARRAELEGLFLALED